ARGASTQHNQLRDGALHWRYKPREAVAVQHTAWRDAPVAMAHCQARRSPAPCARHSYPVR
ncbi:hypothetical protein HAX54_043563, partial [Datura stramonium]|nr:hypothetical protein [Datura stramonium]